MHTSRDDSSRRNVSRFQGRPFTFDRAFRNISVREYATASRLFSTTITECVYVFLPTLSFAAVLLFSLPRLSHDQDKRPKETLVARGPSSLRARGLGCAKTYRHVCGPRIKSRIERLARNAVENTFSKWKPAVS